MLKWKHIKVLAEPTVEEIEDVLAGMSGKNRVIKFLAEVDHMELIRLRVYRDADQIVDMDSSLLTAQAPLLPMDLPLAEGQLCKIGFYNGTGTAKYRTMAIGYEETG